MINHALHGVVATAVWKGYREIVEWLIEGEGGPRLVWQLGVREREGRSVVGIAMLGGHVELAEWLEEAVGRFGVEIEK